MKNSDNDALLRSNAQVLLATNPNYFGNLSKLKLKNLPKAVLKKVEDTRFEELTCLGYDPDSKILTAIIEVKQQSGYSGGPCTDGSQEYVRFYIDYGDGNWVDHGTAGFTTHDLGFKETLCYAASAAIKPKKVPHCKAEPVLPRVRAILSWQVIPPPNTPDWLPVWGNRFERDIQIDPWQLVIGALDLADIFDLTQIKPAMFKKIQAAMAACPPMPKPPAPLPELKELLHSKDKIEVMRNVTPIVAKLAKSPLALALPDDISALGLIDFDFSQIGDFFLNPKFNTSFEELHCVGYDRDRDLLHGIVQVKRPSGYSGGLCTAGSREYIAFYLDFGAGWEYQGTTSVVVHDIPAIPDKGLWYQAALPVNLDDHKKQWCITGKAKIRAVLSWNTPPNPFDPKHVAHWGDWEECWLEVKPLTHGQPGEKTAVLEAIGSMPVSRIDAAGFANGANIGATLIASESPFGGKIKFSGVIAFAGTTDLEYRIRYKSPSSAIYQNWTASFNADVTTVSGGIPVQTSQSQDAVSGWFRYLPKPNVSVAENLLGVFSAGEEGKYLAYLQIRAVGSTTILDSSAVEAYFVDNTRPKMDVEILTGLGNCGKFQVGDIIRGSVAMDDLHAGWLTLSVTPGTEAHGGTLQIDFALPAVTVASGPINEPASGATSVRLSYPLTLDTSGINEGEWTLDTTGMEPCGYNIRVRGEDRTIVNSSGIGWTGGDIEGFCLE